jgi:outer membrane lipoprotein-sorting protein
MMKRFLLLLACLALAVTAWAQDDILDRLKAANTFETLQASFVQTRHSSMLTKDLKSEGRLVLMSPDRIRWEVLKPYPSVFVSTGELAIAGRRFRMPTDKDFTASAQEGEDLAVKLVPIRRDLKSVFREIIIHADKKSLRIQSALLITPDGDWTQLEFKNVVTNQPVDSKLFEEQ